MSSLEGQPLKKKKKISQNSQICSQIQLLPKIGDLEQLSMDMATFYSLEANLTNINAQNWSQDPYCAAICGQNNWCRVLIERQLDTQTFKCWDMDYGFANIFNINQLQPLWPQFRRLHKMAVKASLAGESPSQVRGIYRQSSENKGIKHFMP